jgi:hypothetical protein
MNNALQNDRTGFLERIMQLAGSTSWREPGRVGGGTPYAARGMTTENATALALAMARKNDRDVGPWVAYAMATGVEEHRGEIVTWLADKLIAGAGHIGARNADRMLFVAAACYRNVVLNQPRYDAPRRAPKDFDLLVNIGVGWLWMTMEAAVERAERALRGPADARSRAPAKMSAQAA